MNNLFNIPRLQSAGNIIIRGYAFKSDLKIKWVRPERILCIKPQKSGDQSQFPELDKSQYLLEFQNSEELKTADEHVQRLFQLGFNRRKKSAEFYNSQLVSKVQRHELDLGSMEAKLAKMTATIRSLQEQMEKYPRNKRMLVVCKEMIEARRKFLNYLRRWDYKRFEWVLDELDLIYKSPPEKFHWVTRKESLVKLTDMHCEDIRRRRLQEYREQLESQQVEFLEKKLKNLQFIRHEQLDCSAPVTVSMEQINEVRSKLEEVQAKRQIEKLSQRATSSL